MYSIQAHDGSVLSLTYSPSYVVSMGSDDKLCVWERVQGHLINSISLVRFFTCIGRRLKNGRSTPTPRIEFFVAKFPIFDFEARFNLLYSGDLKSDHLKSGNI